MSQVGTYYESLKLRIDVSFDLAKVKMFVKIPELELQPLTVFIGPNSSGKSVTAKIISGLLHVNPDNYRGGNILNTELCDTDKFCVIKSHQINLPGIEGRVRIKVNKPNTIDVLFRLYGITNKSFIEYLYVNNEKILEGKLSRLGIVLGEEVLKSINNYLLGAFATSVILPDYREYFLFSIREGHLPNTELVEQVVGSIITLLNFSREYSDDRIHIYEELTGFVREKCADVLRDVFGVSDVEPSDILPLMFRIELPWIDSVFDAGKLLVDYVSWSLLDYEAEKTLTHLVRLYRGSSLNFAPSGISTAFVIEMLIHAFLAARKIPILLVIEEPELHTHPLQAVALGMVMAWFIDKNISEVREGKSNLLRIIVTTHSPELVKGCLFTEHVSINIFKRRRNEITAYPWDGKSRVFGFDEAILLALKQSARGLKAIRSRYEKSTS